MNNNIENIKKNVSFLNCDTNLKHDYKSIKVGRSDYNVPKHQLWEASNTSVLDYFIQPKNIYNASFGNAKYIDFDIPKNDLTFYQFLLKFTLTNNTPTSANTNTTITGNR